MEQVVTDYNFWDRDFRCHRCRMGGKNLELLELGVEREQMAGYSFIKLRAGTLPCMSCRVRQHHALPGLFVPRFEQESRSGESYKVEQPMGMSQDSLGKFYEFQYSVSKVHLVEIHAQ